MNVEMAKHGSSLVLRWVLHHFLTFVLLPTPRKEQRKVQPELKRTLLVLLCTEPRNLQNSTSNHTPSTILCPSPIQAILLHFDSSVLKKYMTFQILDQLSWPSWSTPPPPEPEPEVLDRLIVLALILCSTFLLHRIVQVNIILTGISAMIVGVIVKYPLPPLLKCSAIKIQKW